MLKVEKITYPGAPKDIDTADPNVPTFNGKLGSPMVSEIQDIEDKVQELRSHISRQLDKWCKIHVLAALDRNDHIVQRATNEINGLYSLLERLRKATM